MTELDTTGNGLLINSYIGGNKDHSEYIDIDIYKNYLLFEVSYNGGYERIYHSLTKKQAQELITKLQELEKQLA